MKRPLAWIGAALGCIVLAGCYQRVQENGSLVFSFQLWVPLLVVLGGLLAIPIGLVQFARGKRLAGIFLAVAGPVAAVAIAPGIFLDRVVVNQEGFYSRHGFWWDPTIHQIRYSELNLVRLGYETKTGRRGISYSYHFDCFFKSGKQERVPLGDIMREALPEIAEQFRSHGVPVEIPPNLPS